MISWRSAGFFAISFGGSVSVAKKHRLVVWTVLDCIFSLYYRTNKFVVWFKFDG